MSWFRARSVVVLAVGLLLGMGAVGCSGSSSNPYLNYGPTPTAETLTFTGTLDNTGDVPVLRQTHTFTTTYNGTLSMTLTATTPSMAVGFGIGQWDSTNSTCGPLLSWNNMATPGTVILGNAIAGSFCAQVYDVGNLAAGAQASYTLSVTHY